MFFVKQILTIYSWQVRAGLGKVHASASLEKSLHISTLVTFHDDKSWLKAFAWSNISIISVTLATFQFVSQVT